MYTLLIIGIIFLATLENIWPSITGFISAPKGFIFLGTVHHPGDYFYYLSQFAQGGNRIFTAIDLYTSEPVAPSFIGWSNVLLGRVFHAVGASPITAYHSSLFILTIGAMTAAYALYRISFQKPHAALTAFFLFWLFHAFPVTRDGAASYGDYWNNYAVPRVRLGGVPHQLLIAAASLLLVYCIVRITQKNPPGIIYAGLAIASIILASLQPVTWSLIFLSFILTYIAIHAPHGKKIIQSLRHALPAFLILIISGSAPLIYLLNRFQSPPFSQLKAWESAQQTPLSPEHFLTATGPVFLVALFSLPAVLARQTFAHYFMIIFTAISLFLFLSPAPSYLGITHVRFMSTLAIAGLSMIAGAGIYSWFAAPARWTKIAAAIFLAILAVVMLPNHYKTIRLASAFTPSNTYHYITENDFALLMTAKKLSNAHEVFLVTPSLETQFPALTGRITYYGHPLLTINADTKRAQRDAFFASPAAPAMRDFITSHGITWIITDATTQKLAAEPWIKLIQDSDNFVLYQVQK